MGSNLSIYLLLLAIYSKTQIFAHNRDHSLILLRIMWDLFQEFNFGVFHSKIKKKSLEHPQNRNWLLLWDFFECSKFFRVFIFFGCFISNEKFFLLYLIIYRLIDNTLILKFFGVRVFNKSFKVWFFLTIQNFYLSN